MNDKCTAEQVRDVHWNMAKEYKAIPALAEPHQAMGDAIDAHLRERESAKAAVTNGWPEYVMLRDTGIYDDIGGLGQRIYTTAGAGYEKRKYVLEAVAPMLASARVPDDVQRYHLLRSGKSGISLPLGAEALDLYLDRKLAAAPKPEKE